jgi:hypothetical protein
MANKAEFTRFLGDYMSGRDEGSLAYRFERATGAGRLRLLAEYGLTPADTPREVGVILREDADAAVGLAAAEILAYGSRRKNVPAGSAVPLWPGAPLQLESVTPDHGHAGELLTLTLTGWHFETMAGGFIAIFRTAEKLVQATVTSVSAVGSNGQYVATVEVTLPQAGSYAVGVENTRGTRQATSILPDAFRVL